MTDLFELFLQNSFVAIFFLLVILIVRRLTKSMSKIYVYALWMLLLTELLFAPFFTSPFQTIRNITILSLNQETSDKSYRLNDKQINNDISDAFIQREETTSNRGSEIETQGRIQGNKSKLDNSIEYDNSSTNINGFTPKENRYGFIEYLSFLWILGSIILTVFFLIQIVRLKHKVKTAIKVDNHVWETSAYDIPFVMPSIPAKIYVPLGLKDCQRKNIIAHERQHIKHLDPWIKCIVAIALVVHWFNPFVWLAFSLIGKDIEMFCDECVLKGKGFDEKKQYSQTLLDFSKKSSGFSLTMGFAKNNTENRIKHILYSKKPHLILSIALVALILSCGVLFLTSKDKNIETTYQENELNNPQREEYSSENNDKENERKVQENEEIFNISKDTVGVNNEPQTEGQNSEETEEQNNKNDVEQNNGEEDEFWANKSIVGSTLEPAPDLESLMLKAPNYANNWSSFPLLTEDMFGTPQEKELYDAVNIIGETQQFLLYGTSYIDSMIIKTPDNRYVYAKIPFTSNYFVQPILKEWDYDHDGEKELAIIIYVMHGTGVSIRTLFMVDKAADGDWYMYQLLQREYEPRIQATFDTVYTNDSIKLLFNGNYVGLTLPMDDDFRNRKVNYKFQAGMQIQINFVEDFIQLSADLGGFSETLYVGDYTGHRINAKISYLGEGKWTLKDIRYSDSNVDLQIENALTLYFTGQTEELKDYYMIDGSTLKGYKEKSKTVSILDISYPVDNLDGGEIEAYVTVRLDGSDSLFYVTIPMKMEDSLTDTWKIVDLIVEK